MITELTVGEIARRLGAPLHRVEYILRTRRQVRPAARAGKTRIYSEDDLQFIASELRRIDAENGAGDGYGGPAHVHGQDRNLDPELAELVVTLITAGRSENRDVQQELLRRLEREYGISLAFAADIVDGQEASNE